jgi:hypothetical protein
MKRQTYFISYDPSYSLEHQKCDWTCAKIRTHLLGWTPSPKNLIGRERESEIIWLAELPAPKNLIGQEWKSGITWLAELPAAKNLIGWERDKKPRIYSDSATPKTFGQTFAYDPPFSRGKKVYFLTQFDELYPTIYKSTKNKFCSNFAFPASYQNSKRWSM